MKNRKLIVKVLAGIMAFVMILTLVLSILPSSVFAAKSSSQIREEINGLKSEQEALRSQMSALEEEQDANWESIEEMIAQKDNIDQQINLLHTEIININEQITGYSLLIAEKQGELDEAQAKYDQLNEENKERVRAMEEEGTMSYWSVLFKANSFTDLLDRLNMIEEIAEADERRLEEMDQAAKEVAEARETLEAEKVELEASRDELDASQVELDAKRAEADEILVELNAKERELEAQYNEMQEEEDALSASIAASEKAYNEAKAREEEEARRAAAAAAAANGSSSNSGSSGSSSGSASGSGSAEGWGQPCSYARLSSAYGWRVHPITGKNSFHNGVDLANSQGTPIYAVRSGTVTTTTYNSVYGYYVTINHGDGYSSMYAHLTHYIVKSGQSVSKGQVIGYMGSTGWSTGPHLHFTIYYNGSTVNPMNYI